MKVTLSYSVDAHEIPEKVSCLLDELIPTLEQQAQAVAHVVNNINKTGAEVEVSVLLLDSIRQHLAKIDSRLQECHGILNGYNAYNKQQERFHKEMLEASARQQQEAQQQQDNETSEEASPNVPTDLR